MYALQSQFSPLINILQDRFHVVQSMASYPSDHFRQLSLDDEYTAGQDFIRQQKKRIMFDADRIGHWGGMPMCSHRSDDDHIVLHLKLMRVPFRGRLLGRISVQSQMDLVYLEAKILTTIYAFLQTSNVKFVTSKQFSRLNLRKMDLKQEEAIIKVGLVKVIRSFVQVVGKFNGVRWFSFIIKLQLQWGNILSQAIIAKTLQELCGPSLKNTLEGVDDQMIREINHQIMINQFLQLLMIEDLNKQRRISNYNLHIKNIHRMLKSKLKENQKYIRKYSQHLLVYCKYTSQFFDSSQNKQ